MATAVTPHPHPQPQATTNLHSISTDLPSLDISYKWYHVSAHHFFSILFHVLFPLRLLQNIEQSSLCYTVGRCWLSILNMAVCTLFKLNEVIP